MIKNFFSPRVLTGGLGVKSMRLGPALFVLLGVLIAIGANPPAGAQAEYGGVGYNAMDPGAPQKATALTGYRGAAAAGPLLQQQHELRLYLHAFETPFTAGGFTMDLTPPPSNPVFFGVANSFSWFSNPALNGTFAPGATFELNIPCTLGFGVGARFSLATTDLGGGSVTPLGSASTPFINCSGPLTVTIPVTTPVNLSNQRLKLTIDQILGFGLILEGGSNRFLRGTNYTGTP